MSLFVTFNHFPSGRLGRGLSLSFLLLGFMALFASCHDDEEVDFVPLQLIQNTIGSNVLLFETTSPSTCDIVGYETPDSIAEDLSLPSSIYYDGKTFHVDRIRPYAFKLSKTLRSVVVPESVREIGREAFSHCSALKSVRLRNGVEILGFSCFMDCPQMETINLPSSLWHIGAMSFYGCRRLKDVQFEASVETLEAALFQDCVCLKEIQLPEGISNIGNQAFYGSGLQELIVPEGVTKIVLNALFDCKQLRRVTLPSTLTSLSLRIGDYYDSRLKQIEIHALVPPEVTDSYSSIFNVPLRVPAESVEAYKTAPYWLYFRNIEAY